MSREHDYLEINSPWNFGIYNSLMTTSTIDSTTEYVRHSARLQTPAATILGARACSCAIDCGARRP